MKEKIKKHKKLFAILGIFLSLAVGLTIAYFSLSDSIENVFNAGTYKNESQEVFVSPDDWLPGDTTPKTLTVKNTGTICQHVRVKPVESWKDANGNELPLKQRGQSAAILDLDNESDWIKYGGYYYYNKNLEANQTTTSFLESVTFNENISNSYTCLTNLSGERECNSTGTGYDNATYTLTLEIDTIQCNKSEDVWDVNITGLNNNHTMLDTGQAVNAKWKTLAAGSNKTYTAQDTLITSTKRAGRIPFDINAATLGTDYAIISTSSSTVPIYSWYDDGIIYYYSEAGVIELNPTSSHLFSNLRKLTSIGDFETEDTSNVTTMSQMFQYAGYSATTWNIGDLSGWDTSNVTDMSFMFSNAGYSATTWNIGDLSGWDTSKVTTMSSMFYSAAYNATTWNIGDLSGWDTSNVTTMFQMFRYAGYSDTTWNIGDLSGWDTSNVTTMQYMFYSAGYSATTFNIDLSSWDTSNVTNMSYIFSSAGSNATSWNIGDLSGWDTSKATTMSSMFKSAGYNATSWNIGDLSGWDTSNVTTMSSMFYYAGYNATTWQSIGTLKVYATNIYQMFYNCSKAKATLNIYSNPASGSSGYNQAFYNAATASGALITVNYASTTTNIDNIIATKGSSSNVVKGSVLS